MITGIKEIVEASNVTALCLKGFTLSLYFKLRVMVNIVEHLAIKKRDNFFRSQGKNQSKNKGEYWTYIHQMDTKMTQK